MPLKDQNIITWALGGVTSFCGVLIVFIVKGAKATIEDMGNACMSRHKESKKEIEKLEDDQKSFVTKEYMKDDIKPELKAFGDKMDNFSKDLGNLVTRREYKHDLEIIHEKINKKADIKND